jgi:D-alanine-D-alanine ligase-like ATP-grasp enzyme
MNIGVVFGSVAAEHDVSITTAYAIMSALTKNSDYTIIPLYIDKKGERYYSEKFVDIASFTQDHTTFASKICIDMSVYGKMRCII